MTTLVHQCTTLYYLAGFHAVRSPYPLCGKLRLLDVCIRHFSFSVLRACPIYLIDAYSVTGHFHHAPYIGSSSYVLLLSDGGSGEVTLCASPE